MPRFLRILFASAFVLLWGCEASAAPPAASPDYNEIGTKAFRAFECSYLASLAKKEAEYTRLFNIGLASARTFAKAMLDGKLTKANAGDVPMGWYLIDGPTPDFLAGVVYELATRNALESDQSPLLAYGDKNCSLIK